MTYRESINRPHLADNTRLTTEVVSGINGIRSLERRLIQYQYMAMTKL